MASNLALRDSRKGLLEAREKAPLRTSFEAVYRSSTDDDQELDELDHLHNDGTSFGKYGVMRRHRRVESGAPFGTYQTDKYSAPHRPSWLGMVGRCLRPRTTCMIISAILLGGLILLLGGGGLWVYKTAPEDGVCHTAL